jgi:PiT family inorganic phosphate transporter
VQTGSLSEGFGVIAGKEILTIVFFIFLAPIIGGVISYLITVVTIARNFWNKLALILILSTLTVLGILYMIEYMDVKWIMLYIVVAMIAVFILVYVYHYIAYRNHPSALREAQMHKRLQLLSSAAFSLGHGGADSQKVMGIICAALLVYGNHVRQTGDEKNLDAKFAITELMQIEYHNKDGKLEKFKPPMEVYMDGKALCDAKTKEIIFDDKKLNTKYKNAGIFEPYVTPNGELRAGYKYKTKVHSETMPFWIAFGCYFMIGLGTLMGGWKIVKTMGSKITKVTPLEGVCAETAGALTLFTVSNFGIPVSTTHTITGSIIGVGATKRLSAVRWGVTVSLLWAWILTIPVSALLAAIIYSIIFFLK